MIGGEGKDYFYLDGDSTTTIKDYRKKGKTSSALMATAKGKLRSAAKVGIHTLKQANIHSPKLWEPRNLN
jgi:hypothetical protein